MRILIIDNYDSFTYNLQHLFAQIPGVIVDVVRNDSVPLDKLRESEYDGVIISPGPGDPSDKEYFGQNTAVLKEFGPKGLPILGICLGFQGIAINFGCKLKQAIVPQHGKTSHIDIKEKKYIFENMPDTVEVMRYHSLMIDTDSTIPEEIVITAEVKSNSVTVHENGREIMGIRHSNYPIYGVQFHPESFATDMGDKLAENFISIIKENQ